MPLRSSDRPFSAAGDLTACRNALRNGSNTFLAASYLLPGKVRDAATALYAFCRLADDAIDGQDFGACRTMPARSRQDTLATLARLQERLARIYDCRPCDIPQDRAFADVAAAYGIPHALPEALLQGLEWDAAGRLYEDRDALDAYAARVAGSVGAMMARLMGASQSIVLARACDLGIAMQFTNIARDVGEDARNGRLYLPVSWMREAGLDPDKFLAAPQFTPELGRVVKRLLDAADRLYARSAAGIAALPSSCRPGIHAARLLYAEIGREVERRGLDSVTRRAFVPSSRKALVIARVLMQFGRRAHDHAGPTRQEARFLVDAVADVLLPRGARLVPWWNLLDRWVGVIEMFEALESRERAARLETMERLSLAPPLEQGG